MQTDLTEPLAETGIIPDQKRKRRKRRSRSPFSKVLKSVVRSLRWQYFVVALILAITIPPAVLLAFAADATARVQESLGNIQRVVNGLSSRSLTELTITDFDRLDASVQDIGRSLSSARQQTAFLQRFAFINADLDANFQLLSASEQTALAASDMLQGLQPLLFFLVGGTENGTLGSNIGSGERIIELLRVGQGKFVSAQERMTLAQARFNNINIANVSTAVLLQQRNLRAYFDQLNNLNEVLLDGPDLLSTAFGVQSEQKYLVLSQNSDELRPAGGYISTYGYMAVRRFTITQFDYFPTSATSPGRPSAEFGASLTIPPWWLKFSIPAYANWDGSWYGDFSKVGEGAMWFYDNGNNPLSPVDGVMAIDIIGFERILEGLGSVTVPEYNETITATNFRDVIYRIRADDKEHKKFLAAAYRQILNDWQNVEGNEAGEIFKSTLRAMQEKHIMIYFKNAQLNRILDLFNWSGRQTPGTGDYLMVVDANLGNKSNSSISRAVTLDVQLQTSYIALNRVSISYDYSAQVAEKDPAVRPEHYGTQRDYYNMLQIYAPSGSMLNGSDNLDNEMATDNTNGLTNFITLMRLDYDRSKRYQVSYTTPRVVETVGDYKIYRLLLQKQPGTRGDSAIVTIALPNGVKVVDVTPEPSVTYTLDKTVLEFRTTLDTDKLITITYR